MGAIINISAATGGIEESSSRWSTVIGKQIGPVTTDIYSAPDFEGCHVSEMIGPAYFCRLTAHPHQIMRSADSVIAGEMSIVCIMLQMEGLAVVRQSNREVSLKSNEWTFFETSRPFCITNHTKVEQLCILLPCEFLTCQPSWLQMMAAERFSGSEGIGRLFFQLALGAFEELPAAYPDLLNGVVDGLINLLKLSLAERRGRGTNTSLREAWRTKIKGFIVQHLADPELSIDSVAASLQCSKRYLHSLFKDENETLARLIWNMRLDRCRMNLSDPHYADQSIAAIAYAWGFNTPTHFSQIFKERFGVSPRDYRVSAESENAISAFIAN